MKSNLYEVYLYIDKILILIQKNFLENHKKNYF